MRRQRRTTIIVVGGALAIASVGYGLGTQADDGTAIADNAATDQDGSGRTGGGPPRFERGCRPASPRLRTSSASPERARPRAARLPRAARGRPPRRVRREAGKGPRRLDRQGEERVRWTAREAHDRFATKLADALGISKAKVQAALEKLEGDEAALAGRRLPEARRRARARRVRRAAALMKIRPFDAPGRQCPGPAGTTAWPPRRHAAARAREGARRDARSSGRRFRELGQGRPLQAAPEGAGAVPREPLQPRREHGGGRAGRAPAATKVTASPGTTGPSHGSLRRR